MPPKTINLVGREEAARRLKAEEAAAEAERQRLANAGCSRTSMKDMRHTLCDDCGKFGPWGDGEFRYCADHVPKYLRYLAQFRADEARKADE